MQYVPSSWRKEEAARRCDGMPPLEGDLRGDIETFIRKGQIAACTRTGPFDIDDVRGDLPPKARE